MINNRKHTDKSLFRELLPGYGVFLIFLITGYGLYVLTGGIEVRKPLNQREVLIPIKVEPAQMKTQALPPQPQQHVLPALPAQQAQKSPPPQSQPSKSKVVPVMRGENKDTTRAPTPAIKDAVGNGGGQVKGGKNGFPPFYCSTPPSKHDFISALEGLGASLYILDISGEKPKPVGMVSFDRSGNMIYSHTVQKPAGDFIVRRFNYDENVELGNPIEQAEDSNVRDDHPHFILVAIIPPQNILPVLQEAISNTPIKDISYLECSYTAAKPYVAVEKIIHH